MKHLIASVAALGLIAAPPRRRFDQDGDDQVGQHQSHDDGLDQGQHDDRQDDMTKAPRAKSTSQGASITPAKQSSKSARRRPPRRPTATSQSLTG